MKIMRMLLRGKGRGGGGNCAYEGTKKKIKIKIKIKIRAGYSDEGFTQKIWRLWVRVNFQKSRSRNIPTLFNP